MSMKDRIFKALYIALEETNEQLPESQQLEKDPNTVLFGPDGKLDSLGLVGFVTEAETCVEEEFDIAVSLADEKAMSQKNSPFRSIQTLADYIEQLLKEATDA